VPGETTGIGRRRWRRAGLAALAAVALVWAGDGALARKKPPLEAEVAASLPTDLFGAGEIAHPPATDFAKWTETIARYESERREERALCAKGDCALVRWRTFLAGLAGKDAMAQLRAVNAYMNRFPYRTDLETYGVEDYWATPREFFAKGGDCEDYALAKYLSLRALGWPAERLRLAVIHDKDRDLVHAALIAYHGGGAYLLDIEIAEVTEQRQVARYVPIFAISETGWWSYRPPAPVEAVKAASGTANAATPAAAWRSPHMRHKPGRPAKLAARPLPTRFAAAWPSPHMKHKPAQAAKAAPRPEPEEPALEARLAPTLEPASTTPAPGKPGAR
jgi:predicted transglutaminase-like cysteine proteinase